MNDLMVEIIAAPNSLEVEYIPSDAPTVEMTFKGLEIGPTGPQGPQGIQGQQGEDGERGSAVLNGIVNPTSEGFDGDFYINTSTSYIFGPKAGGIWPAGTSLVGPSGSAVDHEILTNLQGGGPNHYHSNQPINDVDSVGFKSICIGPSTPVLNTQVELNENNKIGLGNISTIGVSNTITTTGGAFDTAGIDSGSSITANNITVTVNDVIDSNTVTVFPDVDLSAGYPWTYKNPTRVSINKDIDDKTSSGVSFYANNELTWEQYVWSQEDSRYFYPAWSQRAYVDNIIVHESGKIAIGGKPFDLTGYKEPEASLEIYCHPFNAVINYDGSIYTDNTLEAQSSNGSAFDVLLNTSHISYFGKYTRFNSMYLNLSGFASSSILLWEYWNGYSWSSLTVNLDTTNNFTQSGEIEFTEPNNWIENTVDNSDLMFFIRVYASSISGNVTANSCVPMGGGRLAVYKSPLDPNPVFSVDPEGRTAVGKSIAKAQLDVVTSSRISGENSGYFQINVPDNSQSVSLNVPTTAPAYGKLLGLSSNTQLSWFDNSLITYFGDGSDGNLTISSGTTTMTRDMFYENVTISGTATINTAGYKLHIKGNLDLSNAGVNAVNRNGISGGTSNGSGSGSAGTAPANGTLGGASAGTSGAAGGTGVGTQSVAGTTANPAEGGASGAGGKGGNNVSVPNAGGTFRAATTVSNFVNIPYLKTDFLRGITLLLGGASGPGGGSGGGDGTNLGRGGGGGGSGGGICALYVNTLITSGSTSSGALATNGGSGGAGGPTATGNVGGGGGGAGGGGGCFYLVYNTKIGAAITGLISASGGAGGNGSNGSGTGIGGDAGNGGNGGRICIINASTGNIYHAITGTGSSGTAGSGITGGTGGAGGVHNYSL